jgi:outer membrane protein OmpA-like peptidoglycan-associated protein
MECQLKELPRVANVTGLLVDAVSGGPVPDGTVTITDNLNRSLELSVDAQGSFQFRNVPYGSARLTVSAPGYLTTVAPLKIEARDDLKPHVLMNPRPRKLDVRVGKGEIILARQIQFVGTTAEVAIDSMAIVEQLAAALSDAPQIDSVEIQVHTDDSGSASYSRRLSQQRADRLVELLTQLGIQKSRLTARGYGPDQPLAPNVNDANRAMNNRVQIMTE